jgi:hypothetical protein
MSDLIDAVNEADRQAEWAATTIHQGHNGHGSDDRVGYAGIAQAQATLALQAEVRAARLQIAEVFGDLVAVLEALDR